MLKNLPPDLVDRFCKRDESAFAELFQLLSSRLIGIVRSVGLSQEDAEEVVDDAFMRLWRRQNFVGPEHLVGCAIRTSKNLAIDRLRKRARSLPQARALAFDREPGSTPESEAEARESDSMRRSIDEELDDLARRYDREILLRSYPEKARSAVEEVIILRSEHVLARESRGPAGRSRKLRALGRYEAFLRGLPRPVSALRPKLGRCILDWEESADANHTPARLLLFHLPPRQQELFAAVLLKLSVVGNVAEIHLREMLLALVRLAEQTKSEQMRGDVQAFIQSGGFPDVEFYACLIPAVEPSGGSAAPGLSPMP